MFENHFNHGCIKKTIIAFGQMFENISIINYSGGKKQKIIKVPLSYGPKDKWLRRLQEQATFEKHVEIDLPRLSFEIVDYQYDPSRKMGSVNNYISAVLDGKPTKLYTPVPYNLTIKLYAMTKLQEDALQLLEQITPHFAPAVTVSIDMIPELKIRQDIPFTLQSIQMEDNWDDTFDKRRVVIQTFTFEAKVNMYGPIVTGNVIKRTIIGATVSENQDVPTMTYDAAVNPSTAEKTDNFTIDEMWR